jgi:ribonucleoside-diphosphate reductase alpha chain
MEEKIKASLSLSEGLIERYFSYEGKSPYEFDIYGKPMKWVAEDVSVTDDRGKLIFTQPKVRRPEFWSALAIKVVANKYFWGDQTKGEREDSVEKLVGRVARYMRRQAMQQKLLDERQSSILADELAAISLNQLAAFNSPVWFNFGIHDYNPNAGGVGAYKFDFATDSIIPALKTDDRPQGSACFIQSIQDNMESIMEVQVAEANLFKAGSGTGTNRSTLRSSREKLTGGGRASGPVSFMKGYDAYAGIIKSGGKTRRAAKMEILNVDHPDIMDFITAKQNEEKKAWALIEQGYGGGLNGEAYGSIAFQNCNMSVRASDAFMEAVKMNGEWQTKFVHGGNVSETFRAREIINKIAEGTWICGDPGMQFDSTINKWHTCKNSGRINASNPCVSGDTKVLLKDGGWARIDSLIGRKSNILTNTGIIQESEIEGSFKTGKKPIYLLTTNSGYEIKLTADHKVFTVNRGFVPTCELTKDDYILLPVREVSSIIEPKDKTLFQMIGVYLGDGSKASNKKDIPITMSKDSESQILQKFADYNSANYERKTHQNFPATVQITQTSARYTIKNAQLFEKISEYLNLNLYSHEKRISDQIFALPLGAQKYVLQGLFTSDGTVANYGEKSQYVALDSCSLLLLKDVQIMLLGFGIKSKLYKNRRAGKLTSMLPDGRGGMKEYSVKEMHSLRVSRSSRVKFEKLIGFMPESPKNAKLKLVNEKIKTYKDYPIDAINSVDYLGEEEVYDLTEPLTHTFVANGITIHNCSEYMFLDDSACNLASINLLKFRTDDGKFDAEKFKKTVRAMIISMELIVDGGSYPTAKIARNSHDFRPLGLGYANLGALLMSFGLPYDSDEGRAVAAAITAIMTGEAYKVSAEMAARTGPFKMFEKNRESMLDVIRMHRESIKKIDVESIPSALRYLANDAWDCWSEALELGEKYGYRNAQATVLAPTGTIAFFMDCDTTGIEPDIALVKYKVLSGGGMLKIVNRSVPLALQTLGYDESRIKEIVEHIDKNDTIEGAPGLNEEHLRVFDCAFKPAKGKRAIAYKGHILMMAVTQPFLSGAISKTINMPEQSTIDEIAEAYAYSWEQGLKAVAIYRENSKRSQPLNTKKTEGEMIKKENIQILRANERAKLPQTRKSVTHKFDIGGHEGYITVGLYDNGKPGELFITMHKEGSTIRGLMDAWATSVSFNLQYGIPVDFLFNKFRHQKFEPSGFARNENSGMLDEKMIKIRTASSIVDYVAQFMLSNFGSQSGDGKVEVRIETIEKPKDSQLEISDFGNEGLTCPHCGGPAKRMGNCAIYCTSCKQTTRSGCGE